MKETSWLSIASAQSEILIWLVDEQQVSDITCIR